MRGLSLCFFAAACGRAEPQPNYALLPLAGGTRVDKVSVYQGVEKALYEAPGVFAFGNVPPPVLAGREMVIRVAASLLDGAPARAVVVTLDYRAEGISHSFGQVVDLSQEWSDADPSSTAVFTIPGADVVEGASVSVSVRDTTLLHPIDGETGGAAWSSELGNEDGALPKPLDVEPAEGFSVVIVPVRMGGRDPDTSEAQLDRIREGLLAAYPLEYVDVSLAPSLTWPTVLLPSGGGWAELLSEISAMRVQASVPENTYYYGLFEPSPSLDDFCASGCTLGLSLLAYTPGDTAAKASIGVGYTGEDTVEVLLHEVGHAHGRDHAPCGTSGDFAYPYPQGGIGAWGYDRRDDTYLDPIGVKDIMSYCHPQWVSDYTFTALHDRVLAVAQLAGARDVRPRLAWEAWIVDGEGVARRAAALPEALDPGGDAVVAEGDVDVVDGRFLPFDHVPGGLLWTPPTDPSQVTLRVVAP